MSPAEIDVMHKAWFDKLLITFGDLVRARSAELSATGLTDNEVRDRLNLEMPEYQDWLNARSRDIRAMIVSGRYGLFPVTASGEQPTRTTRAISDGN